MTLGSEPGLGVALDPERLELYRATPEKREENRRTEQELVARHERRATDTWRFEHGQYPQW